MATEFLNGIDASNLRIINVADPSIGTDGVNLQTLQNFLAGLSWKNDVRAATTTNGTLATAYANGQTIDGVVLATGNRILLKNQTTASENGIWIVASSGSPTRTTDADSTTELNNATVSVLDGTVNATLAFTQTTKNPVIGTDPIVWATFAAGLTYTAGNGLQLSSGAFSILLDSPSGLSVSGTGLKVASSLAGNGLQYSAGVISTLLDTSSGLLVSGTGIKIDTSVVARHYSTDIGDGSSTALVVTHNLGTKSVVVQLRRKSDDKMCITDWVATSTSVVTLTFATAPATNAYNITVLA